MPNTCSNCAFQTNSECHRWPPRLQQHIPAGVPRGVDVHQSWPRVAPTDWCAYWSFTPQQQIATGPQGIGLDAKCATYADTATTTTASPTVIRSVPISQNSVAWIEAKVTYQPSYTTGGFSYAYGAFGRASGNVAAIGAAIVSQNSNLTGAPGVSFAVNTSTQTIDVTVKGVGNTNISWSSLVLVRTN